MDTNQSKNKTKHQWHEMIELRKPISIRDRSIEQCPYCLNEIDVYKYFMFTMDYKEKHRWNEYYPPRPTVIGGGNIPFPYPECECGNLLQLCRMRFTEPETDYFLTIVPMEDSEKKKLKFLAKMQIIKQSGGN